MPLSYEEVSDLLTEKTLASRSWVGMIRASPDGSIDWFPGASRGHAAGAVFVDSVRRNEKL